MESPVAQAIGGATDSETAPVIHVQDLVKRYPSRPVNAVDGVSFDVRRGEIFGLLGHRRPDHPQHGRSRIHLPSRGDCGPRTPSGVGPPGCLEGARPRRAGADGPGPLDAS